MIERRASKELALSEGDDRLTKHIKDAQLIRAQAERIRDLVSQLLKHARVNEPQLTPLSRPPLIQEILELLSPVARAMQVRVTFAPPSTEVSEAKALVNPALFHQALINLLMNALQASSSRGEGAVRLSLTLQTSSDPQEEIERGTGRLMLSIIDNGQGFTEGTARLFDPFWTTKGSGEGTGLGLTIVERIVREHHGEVRAETPSDVERLSTDTRGAKLSLWLPLAPEA
jgi:signal transduction histidine kinase